MLLANKNGERVEATPGDKAYCPSCAIAVTAKCGQINIWHWAHHSIIDCDTWSEGESKWHYDWKRYFGLENCEIKMGPHRADVFLHDTVIELQHSSISPGQISEREGFYKKMIWIFDGTDFINNLDLRAASNYFSFRWKHPKKSLWACKAPVFIDMGYSLFQIKKIYHDLPCGGYGHVINRRQLQLLLKNGMPDIQKNRRSKPIEHKKFLVTNPDFFLLKPLKKIDAIDFDDYMKGLELGEITNHQEETSIPPIDRISPP